METPADKAPVAEDEVEETGEDEAADEDELQSPPETGAQEGGEAETGEENASDPTTVLFTVAQMTQMRADRDAKGAEVTQLRNEVDTLKSKIQDQEMEMTKLRKEKADIRKTIKEKITALQNVAPGKRQALGANPVFMKARALLDELVTPVHRRAQTLCAFYSAHYPPLHITLRTKYVLPASRYLHSADYITLRTLPYAHPRTFPYAHSPTRIPPRTFPHAHSPTHIPARTFLYAHSPTHIPLRT